MIESFLFLRLEHCGVEGIIGMERERGGGGGGGGGEE